MASIRGILNIQSLNELTSENEGSKISPSHRGRSAAISTHLRTCHNTFKHCRRVANT